MRLFPEIKAEYTTLNENEGILLNIKSLYVE